MRRLNTPKELMRYYQSERSELSLLHKSVTLSKLNGLLHQAVVQKTALPEGEKDEATIVLAKVASDLFENMETLDTTSVLHTLKVLAYNR